MAEERAATSRAGVVRRVLLSRAVIELGAMSILAIIYNTVRAGGGDDDRAEAMAHARDIANLEGVVFRHLELSLDHWIITVPVLAVAACYFYALMHYVMTPTILVLSRRRGGWRYWRGYWALVVGSAIALVIYANWPLAPPRLMPELGTIDVMQHFAAAGWWGDAASAPRGLGDATNQFAAMPSLHFGWSLWCGIQMWGFGRRRWRIAAVAYPTLQALVVLATANHFLLDVVGGAACILLGYAVVTLVGRALGKTGRPAERGTVVATPGHVTADVAARTVVDAVDRLQPSPATR
ncbi:phosphatase PAP2 family protein [Nocardioides pocheonensis]|uniref:Inositol phosphorylceramide synthase n=1 Tax=Nocardioides pocheonensis TaxID=661485 RepID=A0A3N0GXU5_9ACTN|nr:phosphatase PAP2 family protein [Nocardioides pocheonensis]RNM16968.1 inositol phosphorylceramide synthase [Nocardioides pocheonensis]